jgi:hypothetical protein
MTIQMSFFKRKENVTPEDLNESENMRHDSGGPIIEYIAELCRELAQMAAKAQYSALADLLFRAEGEAKLGKRTTTH